MPAGGARQTPQAWPRSPAHAAWLVAGLVAAFAGGCRREGGPAPDAHALACGPQVCDARVSYCEVIKTDAPELPSDYACKPLPAACRAQEPAAPPASCDCFPAGTKCQYCVRLDAPGARGFRRMCVGGV